MEGMTQIDARGLPLLPVYLFPYHKLLLFHRGVLSSPPLPHQSVALSDISVSIRNGISGHRLHAHSLWEPCANSISPPGCPLSSLQQAVGYSAGFIYKEEQIGLVFLDNLFGDCTASWISESMNISIMTQFSTEGGIPDIVINAGDDIKNELITKASKYGGY